MRLDLIHAVSIGKMTAEEAAKIEAAEADKGEKAAKPTKKAATK